MDERQQAADALEDLLAFLQQAPRTPSPVEAPWIQTLQLVSLEFAWAFARVGQRARAGELSSTALAALRLEELPTWWQRLRDRLPGGSFGARKLRARVQQRRLIADLYELRIQEALRGDSQLSMQVPPWAAIEATADFTRYFLHRTVSVSRVLSPWLMVDAKKAFESAGEPTRSAAAEYLVPLPRSPPQPLESLGRLLAGELPGVKNWEEQHLAQRSLYEAAPLGLAAVLIAIDSYRQRWSRCTDHFVTNSLWCLSVLLFVDAAVFAIAEAVNPLTPPVWEETSRGTPSQSVAP